MKFNKYTIFLMESKKTVLKGCLLMLCMLSTHLFLHAQFTFPASGPHNVTSAGLTINVNDVGNSASVTSGQYGSFDITADWTAGGGNPWSSEAEILLITSAGSFEVDPPTSGGANNGNPTTLTFSGGLPGLYDPDVDGFLDLFMDQSFGGSDATWSNVTITLNPFVAPPIPTTDDMMGVSGCSGMESDTNNTGSGDVYWLEVVVDGASDTLTLDTEGTPAPVTDTEIGIYDSNGFLIASDDDDGTGFLSSLTVTGLAAGTYYVAASTFNTTFGAAFNVTTTGTAAGDIVVNATWSCSGPPVTLMCTDITVDLDLTGNYTLTSADSAAIVAGSMNHMDVMFSPNTYSCADIGDVPIAVSELSGAMCNATVTVQDNTPPQAFCVGSGNFVLMPSGMSVLQAFQLNQNSADNCTAVGDLRFSFSDTDVNDNVMMLDCSNIGSNSITMYVWDEADNVSSCTATITVSDETPPDAMCNDITVSLDANGMYTLTSADSSAITSVTTDACGTVTSTFSPSSFTCADIGVVDVTVTYSDGTNESSCVAGVTVQDTMAPVAVCNDIVVYVDDNGEAVLSSADSAAIVAGTTDNCGDFMTTFSNDFFTCGGGQPDLQGSSRSAVPVVIEGTSFENEPVFAGIQYTDTGDASMDHALANNVGEPHVNSTVGSELEYMALYRTSGSNGLTDGDFFGVNDFTGTVGAYTDGTQGYQMSDVDGFVDLVFSSVDVTGYSMITVNFDLFIQNTGYEGTDILTVAASLDGGLPTNLLMYGEPELEGNADAWMNLSFPVAATSSVDLVVTFASNSASEAIYLDNVRIMGEAAGPAPTGLTEDITVTYTDGEGNSSNCTATITIVDTIPPDISCFNSITVELDANGQYVLTPQDSADLLNGTSDNCTPYTAIFRQDTFTCADVQGQLPGIRGLNGVPVTVVVSDTNGNVDSCEVYVEVLDLTPPVAMCQDVTVYLDASGMATISPDSVDNGSMDVCTDVSLMLDITSVDCDDVGAPVGGVDLLLDPDAEDWASWTTSTTSTADPTPSNTCGTSTGDPVFQYGCTGGYPQGSPPAPPATFDDTQYTIDDDNAGSGVNGIHCIISPVLDLSNGGVSLGFDWQHFDVGASESLAEVYDGSSWTEVWNSTSVSGSGTESGIDLSGYTNADFQVRLCHDDGGTFGWGSAFDNVSVSANAPSGGAVVTLTVEDEYGNSSNCTANVTVLDTLAPMCAAMDMTVTLDPSGMASIDSNALDMGSTDNCGIASITLSQMDFTCADAGDVIVTQTVTDVNGNSSTCDATVTVVDDEDPVIMCSDTTIYANDSICGYQIELDYVVFSIPIDTMSIRSTGTQILLGDDDGSTALPIGFDFNFYGNVYNQFYIASNGYLSFNSDDLEDFSEDPVGTATLPNDIIAVAWEDLRPNAGGQPAANVITYETMGTAPNRVLIVEYYNVDHFFTGDNVTAQAKLYEGSNAIEIHTVAQPQAQAHTQGIENADGSRGVAVPGRDAEVWTAFNDAYRFEQVLSANFGNVTATDNCGAMINTIAGVPADGVLPVGANVITYEAVDPSGNAVTCMATVTVVDTFPPDAVCNDITVYLDQSGAYSLSSADEEAITDGTTDNCMTFTTVISQTDFDCSDTVVVVDVTYTDQYNNVSNCTSNITVVDTLPAFVGCQEINVPLNNMGQALVPVNALVNFFLDNCTDMSDMTVSFSPTDMDSTIAMIGCEFVVPAPDYVEVPIYFWDESGNMTECIAGIRADDLQAPMVVCNDITVDLGGSDTLYLTGADSAAIIAGTVDNCDGELEVTFDPPFVTCGDVGSAVAVMVTVSDPDDNTDDCTAMVTVTKTGGPTAVCNDITISLDPSSYELTAMDSSAIVMGAGPCVDSVTFSQTMFTCADLGASPIAVDVTYWFNGISSMCVSNVTIEGGLAGVVFVDMDAVGANNGSSWADAFTTLSEALAVSGACGQTTEIWVAEGTYSPSDSAGMTPASAAANTYVMLPGVGIYGGFDGTEVNRTDRNFLSNQTILDGGDAVYHVVTNDGNGLDDTAILDGFTVTGGNANGTSIDQKSGGGMYNNASSPLVENCIFSENTAVFGGGMMNRNNAAIVLNTFFKSNEGGQGGGLFNWQGSTSEAINCVFVENVATKDGAGAFTNNASPSFVNVSFSLNAADRTGGAIGTVNGGTSTLVNSILWGDTPNEVYTNMSTTTITYSIVEGGHAGVGNLDEDPLYVDAAGCDLSLDQCSPAIDAGDDASNGEEGDILGFTRIANASIDMGAYEYQGTPGSQGLIYVSASAGGNNDGTSWADAYNELSDALTDASTATPDCGAVEIWVAAGTYSPIDSAGMTPSSSDYNAFVMVSDVGIYGGFDGTETMREERDWVTNVTTLDGGGSVYHVVSNIENGLTETAILDGFTVTGGSANGPTAGPDWYGGGMLNISSSPTVNNCIFTGNDALFGGGMFNRLSSSRVQNTQFISNTGKFGAGMFNWKDAATEVVNCIFSMNAAQLDGGGMFNNKNSLVSVINTSFSANNATRFGGGIYSAKTSTTTVRNSILWENAPVELEADGTSSNDVAFSDVFGGAPGVGNIDSNPVFVNPGASDLRVFPGSPVIDAGNNADVPADVTTDLEGDDRIQGGTVDMGAYEGVAGPVRKAEEGEEDVTAKLYPNPTTDWLNVELEGSAGPIEWELRDMRGGVVKQGVSALPEFQIDLSASEAQHYILLLQAEDKVIAKQVIRIRS